MKRCAIYARISSLNQKDISVEAQILAPLVGLSDVIVDIVETGSTMKQNGLKVVETILDSSAYLIANKNSFIEKKEEITSLYYKINEVIQRGC